MNLRLIRLLKRDLAQEMEGWIDDGLIAPEQVDSILQRYGIKRGESSTLGYEILIGLGFLFVGLSLITLIGANWDEIPRWVRMAGLVVLTASTQGVSIWLVARGQNTRAIGGFFLANLFYGASIILIAQIYHLGEHMPDGVFWWALGCGPTAILLRSRLLALQMLVLAVIWMLLESSLGFYPALFPMFFIAAGYVLVRSEGSLMLFMATFLSFGFWIECSLAAYWQSGSSMRLEAEHVVVTIGLFGFAYSLSHWLNRQSLSIYRDYGAVLGVWALRFVLFLCFYLSFLDPWEELIEANWEHLWSMTVIAGCFWVVAGMLAYGAGRLVAIVAAGLLMAGTTALVILVENDVHAIAFQVAYNVILVALGVGLILRGVQSNVTHYFWTGVGVILLVAMIRYFDLVGDYIGGAILFILMAGVLLGAARFWKQRTTEVRT